MLFVDDMEVDIAEVHDEEVHVFAIVVLESLFHPLVVCWVSIGLACRL